MIIFLKSVAISGSIRSQFNKIVGALQDYPIILSLPPSFPEDFRKTKGPEFDLKGLRLRNISSLFLISFSYSLRQMKKKKIFR